MPESADNGWQDGYGTRYLAIATVIVWTLAVAVAGALIGGYAMIAALIALFVVCGLVLGAWAVVSDVEGALQASTGGEADVSRVGTAFALGGAGLGVIAVWLPFWDPASVRRAWEGGGVEIWGESGRVLSTSDSLIQRGLGWLFIALAIWCAVSVLLAHSHPQLLRGSVDAAAAGICTISLAAFSAAWAVLSTPTVFAVQTWESLDPGLSVYAEGVAGLLMLIGGLRLRRARPDDRDECDRRPHSDSPRVAALSSNRVSRSLRRPVLHTPVNQPDCESRPFRGRYLIIAALVVWVLIVGAAALIAPALVSVTLSVLVPGALVIVAATLLGRGWGATLVDLALVAILVLGVLYALRNTLEWYPCDASGTDPRCGEVSNAPGP